MSGSVKNGKGEKMSRYINADVLCKALLERWHTADKNAEDLIRGVMADIVVPIVVSTPSADVVERKRGEWVKYPFSKNVCYCSNCHYNAINMLHYKGKDITLADVILKTFNFCPNCGADMRTEQTEPEEICDRAEMDCKNCWKRLHCRANEQTEDEYGPEIDCPGL